MISLKKIILPLLLILVVFSACKKDQITDETVIINPPVTEFVNSSVSGIVIDEDHQPLEGANVSIGSNTVMTDENGVFLFKDLQLADNGALVTAEKDGYFYNAKFVQPALNKLSYTKFKLTQKVLSGTIETGTGGTISTNGGAKVTFPSNGIKNEANGAAYTGTVNIYATWIDPTGADLYLEMPGDLRGMNTSDEQVQLTSFGMIGVELEGSNGEALNLTDGQTATINMPIPNTLLGNAPATIPLWHFDEASGMWVEEGEATLEGDKYVGTVGHFSFWNCDVPSDFIDLTGSVINEGGGIANVLVKITDNSSGVSAFGYTNEDGVFNGFVPNDEVLTIAILDNCDNEIYSAQIGPFSNDATIDPIIIDNNNSTTNIAVSGSLENCDMVGVSSGYIKMEFGNTYSIIHLNTDGTFSGTVNICDATEITLTGLDLAEAKQSQPQSYDVTGMSELDAGVLIACDDLSEYLISYIGADSVLLLHVDATFSADITVGNVTIIANDTSNSLVGYMLVSALGVTEVGVDYTPNSVQGVIGDFTNTFADCTDAECDNMTVTYQSLDWTNPGDVVQGSYEGNMINQLTGDILEVHGSFRVVKD